MDKPGQRTVGFCGQYVAIPYNSPEAKALVDFLCLDLSVPTDPNVAVRQVYDVVISPEKPMLLLRQGEKQLYAGKCRYSLAYCLINEIIYQTIVNNDFGPAIHAAAIAYNDGCILLPGKSGSGKSTLTAWLASRGCRYLTDELVIISGSDPRVYPFTRPITLKAGSAAVISSFLNLDKAPVLAGRSGFMLPHRLLNTHFSPDHPVPTHIIFAGYQAGAAAEMVRLTSAEGCFKLMACYVNARTFKDHGIGNIAALVKNTPVYRLTHGGFDGLPSVLSDYFPELFPHEHG